jgi:hypothetical protein
MMDRYYLAIMVASVMAATGLILIVAKYAAGGT